MIAQVRFVKTCVTQNIFNEPRTFFNLQYKFFFDFVFATEMFSVYVIQNLKWTEILWQRHFKLCRFPESNY